MTGPPDRTVVDDLTQNYRAVLLRFLPRRDEAAREAAYELGRRAFTSGVSLLVLCRVHHDVVLEVLGDALPEHHVGISANAGELLLDVLGAYDMTHRSVLEP